MLHSVCQKQQTEIQTGRNMRESVCALLNIDATLPTKHH
jgi:hypothetical protein